MKDLSIFEPQIEKHYAFKKIRSEEYDDQSMSTKRSLSCCSDQPAAEACYHISCRDQLSKRGMSMLFKVSEMQMY